MMVGGQSRLVEGFPGDGKIMGLELDGDTMEHFCDSLEHGRHSVERDSDTLQHVSDTLEHVCKGPQLGTEFLRFLPAQ